MDKLNLKYKIIERYDNYSITVRYWVDPVSEEDVRFSEQNLADGSPARCKTDVSITIPADIETSEDLEKIIINAAPINVLKHELLKKNPDTQKQISFFIESFMDKIHEKEIDLTSLLPPNDEGPPELTDEEIENILKQITDNSNNEK